MLFDTIFGLPVHSLVVHAVVVFVPLAALGTIAVAAVPRWDRRYGLFVVAAALIATGSAFVAKQSGEELASRIGTPLEHFEIARWMPWFALALLLVVAVLWWLDRATPRHHGGRPGPPAPPQHGGAPRGGPVGRGGPGGAGVGRPRR